MSPKTESVASAGSERIACPPQADELELSLFGSGCGECAVVHLGANEWMVVDSCLDEHDSPVSLAYLKKLGIDAAKQVLIVVASHWHDDHVHGLSAVFEECKKAKVVFASALTTIEFQTVMEAYGDDRMLPGSSGVQEMKGVIKCLESRSTASPSPHELSCANKRIHLRGSIGECSPIEVWTLSPSDSAALLAIRHIAAWSNRSKKPKRRVESQSPNHLATVLWVDMGGRRMLLGADLEESNRPDLGWQAILCSKSRPSGKAEVFKVPHHGSCNAHSPGVWQGMLDNPVSALTPFTRSSLPRPSQIELIASLSREAYLAAPPRPATVWSPPDPAVAKTLRESNIAVRNTVCGLGHIRVRWLSGTPPVTEVFGLAHRLGS